MSNSSNLYFSKNYSDFETYSSDVEKWNLDHKKISAGKFFGHNSLIDVGKVQLIRTQLNGSFDQNGLCPLGYRTFVIPANQHQSYYWLNRKLDSSSLLLFQRKGIIDLVSFNSLDVYIISIEENHLHSLIEQFQFNNLDNKLDYSEKVFPISIEFINYIHNYLQIIFTNLQKDATIINSPDFIYNLEYKLPFNILSFIDKRRILNTPYINRKRDIAIQRCETHIKNNLSVNISLLKLTEIANVSERTLEYAFLERFGITPKSFISLSKMNKINNIFKNPSNKELVSTIANKFGFTHMGQFAADYKSFFGELPSKTILRMKSEMS